MPNRPHDPSNLHAYYSRRRDIYMRDARDLKKFIVAGMVKNHDEATTAVSQMVRKARHANHVAIEMCRYEKDA